MLSILERIVRDRYKPSGGKNGGLTLSVKFAEDPAAANEPEILAEQMRLLKVKVYLDVAMVGKTLAEVRPVICLSTRVAGCV
jgi:hypothetical protein